LIEFESEKKEAHYGKNVKVYSMLACELVLEALPNYRKERLESNGTLTSTTQVG